MSDEIEVVEATPADLSDDMKHHQETLANFIKLLVYSIVGLTIVLAIIFLALKDRGTLVNL